MTLAILPNAALSRLIGGTYTEQACSIKSSINDVNQERKKHAYSDY
jgi:hypothetical protein